MDFISVPLEKNEDGSRGGGWCADLGLRSEGAQERRVRHIHEGVSAGAWVCQARSTLSESLPKRVGTCLENCCVDGAKHGKEQQQWAGVASTWPSSGMGKSVLNVKVVLERDIFHGSPPGARLVSLSSCEIFCVSRLHSLPKVLVHK